MKKLYLGYLNSFRGLSSTIWWLALITLINRAGTMVIPFLSLYLNENLGYSLEHIGILMTCFGLGSLSGSWIGGKLTDLFGYYRVMVLSLIGSGLLFIGLQFLTTPWSFGIGIFVLMTVAEAFRPASYVATNAYSTIENKTRSVTLIRLAINLGFSVGPALGGFIIAHLGYSGLFWVDGFSCIAAGVVLLVTLHPKKVSVVDTVEVVKPKSAYNDIPYVLFIGAMIVFSFIFVQYFSTVPLYYAKSHGLSPDQIGLLLAMNGGLIFLLEMPLIKYIEQKVKSKIVPIIWGLFLVGLSFLLLNLSSWTGVLIIGMILMTIGEMIAFPFSNAFAMQRSQQGNQGEYMALYSIAFSLSHVFAHNIGMQAIANFDYTISWYGMVIIALFGILLLLLLQKSIKTHYESS